MRGFLAAVVVLAGCGLAWGDEQSARDAVAYAELKKMEVDLMAEDCNQSCERLNLRIEEEGARFLLLGGLMLEGDRLLVAELLGEAIVEESDAQEDQDRLAAEYTIGLGHLVQARQDLANRFFVLAETGAVKASDKFRVAESWGYECLGHAGVGLDAMGWARVILDQYSLPPGGN